MYTWLQCYLYRTFILSITTLIDTFINADSILHDFETTVFDELVIEVARSYREDMFFVQPEMTSTNVIVMLPTDNMSYGYIDICGGWKPTDNSKLLRLENPWQIPKSLRTLCWIYWLPLGMSHIILHHFNLSISIIINVKANKSWYKRMMSWNNVSSSKLKGIYKTPFSVQTPFLNYFTPWLLNKSMNHLM